MSNSDDDVLQFIAASFPSVWALELLLALKHDRRAWTREQLVLALRASELVVAKALDALVAVGLASIEGEGAVYLPVNRDVEDCLEQGAIVSDAAQCGPTVNHLRWNRQCVSLCRCIQDSKGRG